MANKPLNTDLFDRAAKFAIDAHHGTERRGKGYPYILHVMEAAEIVATMTNDQALLAAAMLHDVIEDTDVTDADLRKEFGDRIADLVCVDTNVAVENMPEEDSWVFRKEQAIESLRRANYEGKMVALGDKLSNMRAIARDYAVLGDELWKIFHAPQPGLVGWYYDGLSDALKELEGKPAYTEFAALVQQVFHGEK